MFKSNADFGKAVSKLITLAVVLMILSTYSQQLFISIGMPARLAPTSTSGDFPPEHLI